MDMNQIQNGNININQIENVMDVNQMENGNANMDDDGFDNLVEPYLLDIYEMNGNELQLLGPNNNNVNHNRMGVDMERIYDPLQHALEANGDQNEYENEEKHIVEAPSIQAEDINIDRQAMPYAAIRGPPQIFYFQSPSAFIQDLYEQKSDDDILKFEDLIMDECNYQLDAVGNVFGNNQRGIINVMQTFLWSERASYPDSTHLGHFQSVDVLTHGKDILITAEQLHEQFGHTFGDNMLMRFAFASAHNIDDGVKYGSGAHGVFFSIHDESDDYPHFLCLVCEFGAVDTQFYE